MADTLNYKLLVSLDRKINSTKGFVPVLIPYKNQVIPGVDIPDEIDGPVDLAHLFDVNMKYIVYVNFDATEVISVDKTSGLADWWLVALDEVNRFNKNVIDTAGKQQRNCAPKPDWLFMEEELWEFLIATVKLKRYPLIMGPTGCGKTVTAQAIAEALGYDFFPLNCGSLTKPKATLIGTVKAENGSTHLAESEFLKFFRSDRPTIVYLDELSRISSEGANRLFPVLDRVQNYIYVEELSQRVYKGEDVVFVCAANFGSQYVDTRRLDEGFKNRFIPIHMDYLPEDEEFKLLKSLYPKVKDGDLRKLCKVATILRKNFESLGAEVSHRHTIDTAAYLTVGFTVKEAVKNVIINLFVNGGDDRRNTADQMIKSVI